MLGADATPAGQEPAAGYFSSPAPDRYSVNSPVELDFSVLTRDFLDGLSPAGQLTGLGGGRRVLPADHVWSKDGKTRAPMALCELVAYKTALAYEDEAEIKASLGDAPHVRFFDSSRDGLVDTQGFAFIHDGMAFVIMRGTEKGSDWTTNLQHQLTDELQTPRRQKLGKELKKQHGDKILPLLDGLAAKPGRHLGFAIGWAAVHDEIAAHLQEHCPPGMPVVLGGHSLGGALALIGALELKRTGHDIAAVITFGAPQAGNDAFSREYAAEGLSVRTVLFEAQGDSVPRLLRRWYYRLHSSLRSRLVGFLTAGTEAVPRARYAVTGNPWTFLAQPALSAREVKDAVKSILDARERRAKEEQERKAQSQGGRGAGTTPAAGTPTTPASSTSQT
jgi:Lipase (class 3)